MTVTAADYLWFEDGFPDIAEAYCFTLVKDLAPAELLQRLDGEAGPSLTGVTALVEAADDLGDTQQTWCSARSTCPPPATTGTGPCGSGRSPCVSRCPATAGRSG
ncbi:DUF6461 domain-containing protein [Kitasatospora purpeofusca]|uniref:DUF6461 domain-containing protein n=1 Tax=Kitasatospora TaxID=2063 RepID=UPI001FCA3D59|nr:DUF6461 domain-containing protein [Kitasatospora purpeofusca]